MGREIIPFDFYTVSAVKRGRFMGGAFVHNSCQSMCFDSKNQKYIVGFAEPGNVSALVRIKDLSFAESAIEAVERGLPLDHCNDMVYSPEDHKIYVVGGNWWVAVVDPDTLRVEQKITIPMIAWSLARYPNGDFFVHDGGRGERFTYDFSSSRTVSSNDRETLIDILHVPYRPKRGDWAGVWQGAIVLDGMPFMIYNELSIKTGEPISFVLFSCEMGEKRTIYRAETGHEIESADFVDGKMMLTYNEPYRYGGCSWEMSEILTKTIYAEAGPIDLPNNKEVAIDLSSHVPEGYVLVSANVNFKKNGETLRAIPFFGTNGSCILKIVKVYKNRVYLKSSEAYIGNTFQIIGMCRKK